MSGTRLITVGGVAALALLLTSCATPASTPTASTTTPAASVPTSSTLPSSVNGSTPAALPTEGALDEEPAPVPGVENDALALATAAVTAFCRPTLDYDMWIGELYPFLTQEAAVAYETVDPANVPCTTLTGDARVRDGDGTFTIRVLVPTDAGDYSVYVHRTVETGPWAVEQITPLASE